MLKFNCDRRTISDFAVKLDRSTVINYSMFYDRKPKTGAAGFFFFYSFFISLR